MRADFAGHDAASFEVGQQLPHAPTLQDVRREVHHYSVGIASAWRERLKSHTQRYNPTIATVACGSVPFGSECILAIGRLIGILLWLHYVRSH